jgi:hypothetical protein
MAGAAQRFGNMFAGEGDGASVGIGRTGLALESVYGEADPGLLLGGGQNPQPEGGVGVAFAVGAVTGAEFFHVPEGDRPQVAGEGVEGRDVARQRGGERGLFGGVGAFAADLAGDAV